MKYPLENTTVWDLIRHPFDEDSGDPGSRTFMRVLSNIFFPIYVFLQVYVPFQVTMDVCLDSGQTVPNVEQIEQVEQHAESQAYQSDQMVEQLGSIGQQEDTMWLTVIVMFKVWLCIFVGFWAIWVIMAVLVRYFTSTYFHRQLIVGFCGVLYLCTKKGSPNNIKWNERLDKAMLNLEFVKTEMAGKELSLADIINPSLDVELAEKSISSYMKSLKGKYNGNNMAKLFLTLCKTKVLATDNLACFCRVMSAQYTDGEWVIPNVIQKSARKLFAKKESERVWEKEIMQKYFPQINLDELNTDNA